MTRWSSVTIGIVAVGCLAGANPASAQGPYYPPPAWDQKLPASTRFVLVLFEEVCVNSVCAQIAQGVLDRETGLVWERSPSSTQGDFLFARSQCAIKVHADRFGWRAPSVDELTSLLDPMISTGAALPAGHPFLNITGRYWTSTVGTQFGTNTAFFVEFLNAPFDPGVVATPLDNDSLAVWCVRGGAK